MVTYYAKEIQATFAHAMYPDTPQHDAQSWAVCNVHGSNNWIYRAFLKHDITGIPYKSVITSAKLFVFCNYHHDNAATAKHNLTRVMEDWNETTLTWNNKPEQNTEMYLDIDATPPSVGTWGSYDITRMVQEWVDGVYPNYGLQFVNIGEGAYRTEWRFANRRGENGTYATYIEIEYEPTEEYRITRTRTEELATEIRRITAIEDTLSPAEMKAALESLVIHSSTSKITDTIVPTGIGETIYVNLSGTPFSTRGVVDENTAITMRADVSLFGDATEADVVAGKTFTSAAGFKMVGTNTGGSGSAVPSAEGVEF